MLSRLALLVCAREMAQAMERGKVDDYVVREWMRQVTETVCTAAQTVDQVRLIEDKLAVLFRSGSGYLLDAENEY